MALGKVQTLYSTGSSHISLTPTSRGMSRHTLPYVSPLYLFLNSRNIAGSAALAEVYALLTVILVINATHSKNIKAFAQHINFKNYNSVTIFT